MELVWVRNSRMRLEPQIWPEDRPGEKQRVAARHQIAERHRGLTISDLQMLYPPPEEATQ